MNTISLEDLQHEVKMIKPQEYKNIGSTEGEPRMLFSRSIWREDSCHEKDSQEGKTAKCPQY